MGATEWKFPISGTAEHFKITLNDGLICIDQHRDGGWMYDASEIRAIAAALNAAADEVEGVAAHEHGPTYIIGTKDYDDDEPPVADCVIEAIERLCDVLTSMTLETGLVAHVNLARAAIDRANR